MNTSSVVTCPHCHKKNRVPAARLSEQPRCGVCKEPLFVGRVLPLTASRFEAHVQADLPLLVDFWAPWCGPCRQFAPLFEKVAQHEEPLLRCAKINTEDESALASRFAIRSIPTLILFKSGHELARVSGALPPNELARWIQQHLQQAH